MLRKPYKVIFACVHSAGRSQMAAAFFNHHVDPSEAYAISAGTDPAFAVHPEVVEAMMEVGIDLSRARPRMLTDDLTRDTRILVTMGCGEECPVVPDAHREDWPLADPKGQSIETVRAIRDDIRRRVQNLAAECGWSRLPSESA